MGSGGIRASHYRPLADEQIDQISETALDLLADVGMEVHSEQCLEAFDAAGAEVDGKSVRIPRRVVGDAIASAPSSVTLYARDEERHLHLEADRVYMGTGGTVLQVLDLDGEYRDATLRDLADICRLVDALDSIHFIVLPTYPTELPPERIDVNRFYTGLRHSRRHIMGGVYTREGIEQVIRMGEIVAGGPAALRERPIVSFITCLISPLKIDQHYGDFLCQVSRAGLPVVISLEPLSGATAPITLAGNLVQWSAEVLGGLVLTQAVREGAPAIVGCVSTIADLRTMGYLSGAVEMGVLNAGGAQLAQFWGLPYYATAGMSDSKLPDAQSGYEKAISLLATALAGANYIHDAAGLLNFTMTASFEQYVIDNEIIGMVERVLRGIEVDRGRLAADAIRGVGPGGNYLAHEHTLEYMRGEFYHPKVSERDRLDTWLEKGRADARARANGIARGILSNPPASCLAPEAEDVIVREMGTALQSL